MGGGRQELLDRARCELFSHIDRCKVLEVDVEDQEQWMDGGTDPTSAENTGDEGDGAIARATGSS